jgi:hypothetical protein
MINPTFYYPYRYEIARGFLSNGWRKYYNIAHQKSGQLLLYETLFNDYNKELNQDFLSFESSVESKFCFGDEVSKLYHFMHFKNSGSRIYQFHPYLTKRLFLSDVLETKLSNLSLNQNNFYLALGCQNMLPLPVYRPTLTSFENSRYKPYFEIQYLDGAYIFPDVDNPKELQIIVTTANPNKDYSNNWQIKRRYSTDEYPYAFIECNTNEIAFSFKFNLSNGKKIKEVLSSGVHLDFNIIPYSVLSHYEELVKVYNEIVIQEVICLLISCIFYIIITDETPGRVFTSDIPEAILQDVKNAKDTIELERVNSELISLGFNHINYYNGPFKARYDNWNKKYASCFACTKGFWKNKSSLLSKRENNIKWEMAYTGLS